MAKRIVDLVIYDTEAEIPAAGTIGQLIYAIDTKRLFFWDTASSYMNTHNNGPNFMDMDQIATPANPSAGTRRIFIDSADGKMKVRTNNGISVSIEEQRVHPDLATHDAMGLSTDTELSTHAGLPTVHHSNANDHANTNDPAVDQKAALGGTSGVPSITNKYVTDADTRNSNSRAPTAHGDAAHNALTYEASGATATHAALSAATTHGNLGHSNSLDHARQHSITAAADHTFPGDTTRFLRADGTFQSVTASLPDMVVIRQSTNAATTTIPSGYGAVVPRKYTIASGQALIIQSTGALRIL